MAFQHLEASKVVARLTDQIECEPLTYTSHIATQPRPGPRRYLFPAGAYALGLWHPGDDIHLVCLTDNSSDTFWNYIAEKFDREDLPKFDCIISEPGDQETVWLHCCCNIPSPLDVASLGTLGSNRPSMSQRYYSKSTLNNLVRLLDTWHIIACLGDDIGAFRNAYNTLRPWAEAAGIFSKAFGTLDAESLVWILFTAKDKAAKKKNAVPCSSSNDIIGAFVDRYQTAQNLYSVLTPSMRKPYNPPAHIIANGFATTAYEIGQLRQHPVWIASSKEQYYQRFCGRFANMVIIMAECWAPKQRDTFHSQLVAQVALLPEQIRSASGGNTGIRIWPQPFRPSKDEWLYVIGVESTTASWRDLVETMRFDIDDTVGIANISHCEAEEAWCLPKRYGTTDSPLLLATDAQTPKLQDPPSPSKRFPPASQVLSRLRWDPVHTSFDYEVGYLDRFEGLMWLPLDQWGKEVEDEDFIPEHRIRIFKRVARGTDGDVVWDREKRLCELDGGRAWSR